MPGFFTFARILAEFLIDAAVRIAPRSAQAPAGDAVEQAAVAVRARRLLRRLVLGAVFSPLVRRARLRRLRTEPARPRHERRWTDAVHRGPRRLRGRRRAHRRYARLAAGADRTFDGCRHRRAH